MHRKLPSLCSFYMTAECIARSRRQTDLSEHLKHMPSPDRDYNVAMRQAATLALLLVGTAAFASPPDPCSLSSSVSDANITIAISAGRTTFREGEIIPLVLSFTSTADKRYWADNRNYDRSGRLSIETYCVEPEARDPLADYFRAGAFMGGGLGSTQQLSREPFTATAELNEWRQPGPGHYRLHVVSYRVWRPPGPTRRDSLRPSGAIAAL
jgi:hypothetical protein